MKFCNNIKSPKGSEYEMSLDGFGKQYASSEKTNIVEWVTHDSVVSPCFDYDEESITDYSQEQIENTNNNNLEILRTEFPDGEIAVASCHRYGSEKKKYKKSFHYTINLYKCEFLTLNRFMKDHGQNDFILTTACRILATTTWRSW